MWFIAFTLWLFNIAMENGPFIDGLPGFTYLKWWFSMAMLNNQMVLSLFQSPLLDDSPGVKAPGRFVAKNCSQARLQHVFEDD